MSHAGTMISVSGAIRFERKHFNAGEILAIVRFHISQQWTRLLVCHGALHASFLNTSARLAFAEKFVESRS